MASKTTMYSALSPSSKVVRVLAADRTPMDSQLLTEALAQDSQIEICGALCTSQSVLAAVVRERPHILVLSAQLEDGELKGFEVTRSLRSTLPETRVVMLLDSSEPVKVVEAFRCGAKGVFCRRQSLKWLRKCIQRVHLGQVWANSDELAFLLDALAEMPIREVSTGASAQLSKRELDVVRAVVEGRTNSEIARHLGLTEHTVKNYLYRIFDKLGVSTRVELVLHALASGQSGVSQGIRAVNPRPPKSNGPRAVIPSHA